MPISGITLPLDTKTPGTAGHTSDHNLIVDAVTAVAAAAAATAGDTFTGDVHLNGGVLEVFGSAVPSTPGSVTAKLFADSSVGTPGVKVKSGRSAYMDTATADASNIPLTNPTTLTDISASYTIQANDAKAGTTYVLEMQFFGTWQASGAFNLGFDLDGTKTNLVPVAAGMATAGHAYGGVFRLYLQVLTTGAGGTYNVWSDGGITDTAISRTGATGAVLNGHNNGSIDTTASHTLAVCASFSVSNGSQTVTGPGSTLTRKGA